MHPFPQTVHRAPPPQPPAPRAQAAALGGAARALQGARQGGRGRLWRPARQAAAREPAPRDRRDAAGQQARGAGVPHWAFRFIYMDSAAVWHVQCPCQRLVCARFATARRSSCPCPGLSLRAYVAWEARGDAAAVHVASTHGRAAAAGGGQGEAAAAGGEGGDERRGGGGRHPRDEGARRARRCARSCGTCKLPARHCHGSLSRPEAPQNAVAVVLPELICSGRRLHA
jgi:hypothetical protein